MLAFIFSAGFTDSKLYAVVQKNDANTQLVKMNILLTIQLTTKKAGIKNLL